MKTHLSSRSAFQRFSVSAFACLTLSLTACQGVNDVLAGVNNTLGAVNSALGGSSSSSSDSSAVYVDSKTQASVVSAANKAAANGDVRKMFNEAKPAIEKMVATTACTDNASQLKRFADPDGTGYLPYPIQHMMYHKSGCTNVLRINNVKRITSNAFYFTVYYISPQSEETKTYLYRAIKQPEGEWLFQY
ncbi:hypothetical protein A1D29_06805 [Pasteurellaceae bacterium Orientalotternb1]|nr:hypothetical protein A1D29_06805 [Pasteurellaceae bacterium Orientalotternb1]